MYIGGLDVGTTGCKLTVYNSDGEYECNSYEEYDVSRRNGEHETDANIIFSSVCKVIGNIAEKYPSLAAIGVTTFGESFVMLDGDDNVLLPSMLYTDPRGKKECGDLTRNFGEEKLISISGVKPNEMYSLPKLMWIKNNLPDIYKKAEKVLLMEDFIVYMLCGKANIDYSLAARTMAFDIKNKCWSKEIFDASGVDVSLMSEPVPSGSIAGEMKESLKKQFGFKSIKIVNGSHDQVASAVGAGVYSTDCAVDGTGTVECVVPMFDCVPSDKRLYDEGYSVVPYVFDGTYVCYALSFTGGAVLKWYRDNFAKYERELAEKNGTDVYADLDAATDDKPTDLLVLPHFAGAANPYMDSGSKAVIAGLTLEHGAKDIYKALMEGVTYEIMLNIEHLLSFGICPEKLYATGGGSRSEKWLQIKADILSRPVTALDAKESGACGTCIMAATALGLYKDIQTAGKHFVKEKKTFTPNIAYAKIYKERYNTYKKLYSAVREITGEL